MLRYPTSPPKPLRVLFLIGSLEGGGSEGQLAQLIGRTQGRSITASVVTATSTERVTHADNLRAAGVRIHGVERAGARLRRLTSLGGILTREVRYFRPDVIYGWLEETSALAALAAHIRSTPLVIARRNVSGAHRERSRLVREAVITAERSAQLVSVNSRAGLIVAAHRGISPHRTRLIYNGHPAISPLPLPADDHGIRIGYLARFRREKGHLRFLQGLSRLDRSFAWSATLGGDGPLEAEVRRIVGDLGLSDRVSFAGRIEDVDAFWSAHHICALTSDTESLSNSLVEAAYRGRPIVATDVGGNAEVVPPQGILVGLDPSAITSSLAELISRPTLRETLGAAAHAHAAARFDIERAVDEHLRALRDAVALTR